MISVKRLLQNLCVLVLSVALFLAFAELAFRFLPVHSGFYLAPTTEADPVARRLPNPDATTSRGAGMQHPVHSPINNEGFVNRVDYAPKTSSPLLAIIGDSFIEAANIPQNLTCHGVLQDRFGANSIYSFAMSGAPLSQYLVWANYAQTFSPDMIAFVIVFNDFDESHAAYGQFPGYHYFSEDDGSVTLSLREFQPSLLSHLARNSRLIEYSLNNLRIQQLVSNPASHLAENEPKGNKPLDTGISAIAATPERLTAAKTAVDEFLRRVPKRTDIIFVLDALRPALYDKQALERAEKRYFGTMRRYFSAEAAKQGFTVLDLQPRFIEKHQSDGTTFELPNDEHWNEAGHKVCADAIVGSVEFKRIFGQ